MSNQQILEQLKDAESALRENLHRHNLDPTARAHMERALNHTLEAFVAINEIGKARSVQRLVGDLDKVEQILAKVHRQPSPGGAAKSIHV